MNILADAPKALKDRDKNAKTVRAYLSGNAWQDGSGFSLNFLRKITSSTQSEAEQFWELVKDHVGEIFAPLGLIREACERHRDSVLAEEPNWGYNPEGYDPKSGDEKDDDTKALEQAATDWFNNRRVFAEFQRATLTLLHAPGREGYTSSVMRFFVPDGSLTDGSSLQEPKDVLPQLGLMHAPGAVVVYDGYDRPKYAVYEYTDERRLHLEVSVLWRDAPEELRALAMSVLDPQPDLNDPKLPDKTLVLNISKYGSAVVTANLFDLGGNLTMFDMRREPLITADTVKLQRNIDTVSTMIMAGVPSGLPERVLINAIPKGYWYNPSDANDRSSIQTETHTVFQREAWYVGYGEVNNIRGLEEYDTQGGVKGQSRPDYMRLGIIDAAPLRETLEYYVNRFYAEVKQAHALMSGDATASGLSRIQATNDFRYSLAATESAVQYGQMQALELLLHFCNHFLNADNYHTRFQPYVDMRVAVVQPSPEERRAKMEEVDKRLRSEESYITENVSDDPVKEMQRIEMERSSREALSRQAERPQAEGGRV